MKKAQLMFTTEAISDVLLGRQNRQNPNIKVTGFELRSDGLVIIDLEGDGLPDECQDENTHTRLVITKDIVMVDNKPLQIITHNIVATNKKESK